MALRKIGEGLYLYPGSPSTMVKIHDEKAVLVDPGQGSGRHKDLKREMRKLGLEIRAQLTTHGHADHVRVAPKIEAPLFAHRFEFSIVESPLNREILTFGSKAPRGFLVSQFEGEVRVHGIFEWGDVLFGLKAIKLSGHSPGMTGFLDEENAVLYAGDSFFGERVLQSVGIPYLVEPELFKDSIKQLQNYADEGLLLIPSHGKAVRGDEAGKLLEFNLHRLEEAETMILELLKSPMSIDELAYRLSEYFDVSPTPQILALNLVPLRAFIAKLYNEEKIEAVMDRGLKWKLRGD
ncbi:MBL fold metallo-hydrolase [Thermococcus sp.]